MNVTTAPESAAANDMLSARADERLAHAYEQIARADEQLARLTEQLTRMEADDARHPPAALRRRRSRGRPALRALVGLLAIACIAGVAFVSQSSYGEALRPAIERWVGPYVGSISWPTPVRQEASARPDSSGVQLAGADVSSPQAAPSDETQPQEAATPAGALASSEYMQLLQGMARDLATVQQGIEQLRAGQEQLAGDNARTAEQLKASQEQVARLVAKLSEQDQRVARAAAPGPVPRPVADPARKPAPGSQARAQPMQLQPPVR
jgi:hypothetical protein